MNNYESGGLCACLHFKKFIIPTLESLARQTYPNFEIIVCDDASHDNTFEICKRFAKGHPFFNVIRNETNLGWFANNEKLWRIAVDRSDYCFYSPHDDHVYQNFIREQVEVLKENPKAALCIPGMNNCFKNGISFTSTYLNPTEKSDPVDSVAAILERTEYWWTACHGLCKSSIIKQILPVKKLMLRRRNFLQTCSGCSILHF